MRKCYVFLDIDGVLNSDKYFNSQEFKNRIEESERWDSSTRILQLSIDPKVVPLINKLVKETNCKLVLCSRWNRNIYVDEAFKLSGIKRKIYDKTNNTGRKFEDIQHWLNAKAEFTDNYIIISESEGCPFSMNRHFIHIDWKEGLTEEKLDEAIGVLNSKNLMVRDIYSAESVD